MAHGQESSTEAAAGGGSPLCANGCGFYGSAATKSMCSKCYRDHLKAGDVAAPAVEGKLTFDDLILAFKKSVNLQDSTAAPAAEAAAKKSVPNRCMACKKKVGLLGFACRCGGTFCSLHRYVDGHACSFDYKKVGREQIAQQNPLVAPSKLHNKF
ncbi:zinc finger A20 and AN1 domain-containing stress-associated protein 12-like [Triticum urartu]|nr:zinc finger A20 and AN1 domain-containing stress-associated protein 12-like [Triticum urartu]